jgi:nitrogen fixation/metabolism regulation signal transduction histidine kinase
MPVGPHVSGGTDRPGPYQLRAVSTARIDTLDRWAQRIALGVIGIWLFVLVNSVAFARKFVSPIYAMMKFSRRVAGGALAERMTTFAPKKLDELREYLNQMTAELERRELERQVAQTKAAAMQRELLSLSRIAGMAEIATGVLDNVGNVLNSLSVVGDQLRTSRVKELNRSVELFATHPGASVLQAHKRDRWSYARAIEFCLEPSATYGELEASWPKTVAVCPKAAQSARVA